MKILNLLSGGLDSTTMLYKYRKGAFVEAIFFDYGQKHIKEQLAATKICSDLGVKLHQGKLAEMFTPDARYSTTPITTQHGDTDIIVNRNMNLITAAATYALKSGFDAISIATNADDAQNFPDCTKHFMRGMKDSLRFCHSSRIELLTPFIDITKTDVVELARKLQVPIDDTWSCYKGGEKPCGECGACQLRDKAIIEGGFEG
jgi:7-cyano-7-deazaguanine synthase